MNNEECQWGDTMVLAANAEIDRLVDQELREYEVGATRHVYKTGLFGVDPAGYLKPFEVGDEFVGLAYEEADNSSGAAGAINCQVWVKTDFVFTLTNVATKDIGKAVFPRPSFA